jgi:hypothetical protein
MGKKAMSSASNGKGNYEVGYGKPPKAGQFKKGQSGNRKGRKAGDRNMKTIVGDMLDEKVTIKEAGVARVMAAREALILKARELAFKGGLREIERFFKMAHQYCPGALNASQDGPTKVIWEFIESDGEGGPKLSRKEWEEIVEREAKAQDYDDPLDR